MASGRTHAYKSNVGGMRTPAALVVVIAPAPSRSVRTMLRLRLPDAAAASGGTSLGSSAGRAASCASRQPVHTCTHTAEAHGMDGPVLLSGCAVLCCVVSLAGERELLAGGELAAGMPWP